MNLNVISLEERYLSLMAQKAEIERQIEEIKNEFILEYEETGESKFIGESKVFRYIAPSMSRQFDSARFKKEHNDLYEEYTKEVMRKGYISTSDIKPTDVQKQYLFE